MLELILRVDGVYIWLLNLHPKDGFLPGYRNINGNAYVAANAPPPGHYTFKTFVVTMTGTNMYY